MTTEHQASRTLVKSPPELWAECSDPGSLARHIGEFGEIRITRLDPETSIAWEAERAVGTVEIEPSGWGTKVTLTAQTTADEDGQEEVDAGALPEEPAAIELQEEPIAIPEGATETAPDPPPAQADPVEEESDAKVEETVAQSDSAVAADPVPAGGRWRRLIARTRTWFGTVEQPLPGPAHAAGSQPAGNSPDPAAEEVSEPAIAAPEPESAAPAPSVPEPSVPEPSVPEPSVPEPSVPEPLVPEPSDQAAPSDEAEADVPDEPEPLGEIERVPWLDAEAVLVAALDSLGQAHHRPFSRA